MKSVVETNVATNACKPIMEPMRKDCAALYLSGDGIRVNLSHHLAIVQLDRYDRFQKVMTSARNLIRGTDSWDAYNGH